MRTPLFATLAALILLGCSTRVGASPHVVAPTVDDMLRNVQLQGVLNVRDLGGLRGRNGIIPHERFYRSATLAHASRADRDLLKARGVTLDIDLRTGIETDVRGDELSEDPRFSYDHISLLGVGVEDWFRGMHNLYLHTLADHQDGFREVFHAMATHDGGVLYHCTSGKDRTGMVTAILLDLAGVERATIVRDYAISAHQLGRDGDQSPPELMRAFLDALDGEYGGAHAYLTRIGLAATDIDALLAKLGQG
ncbi:MAG TPA: tyrosine-protein phosphatase [Polyangiaceae bacterium]